MFANTIDITYNLVTKTLKRVKDDGYTSQYYLDDGDLKFELDFSHVIPKNAEGAGESHRAALKVHEFSSGEFVRTSNSWMTFRTEKSIQDSTSVSRCTDALVGWLTPANVASLADRES